jgi:L-ribulose-5-phosphate 3-epimerase
MEITRRNLWALGLAPWAGAARSPAPPQEKARLKVSVFSKHLQFVAGEELAAAAARLGFDGIDLTVRKGGHVEPERVRQELPGLVSTIRKHGLEVPMVTTDIVDAETVYAEDILRTTAELGIHNYRWGGFQYDAKQPYPAQLEKLKRRIAGLAALNARYQACAMYHTHSGKNLVGASFWDLYILLEGFDPRLVGVNFDTGHAVIEGGLGGWINSFRILSSRLRGIAVKDFVWGQDAKGVWQPQWKPLGQGMVNFPEFFAMVKESGFNGPVQVHFEYPLGKAPEETYRAMVNDLRQLRGYLEKAGV